MGSDQQIASFDKLSSDKLTGANFKTHQSHPLTNTKTPKTTQIKRNSLLLQLCLKCFQERQDRASLRWFLARFAEAAAKGKCLGLHSIRSLDLLLNEIVDKVDKVEFEHLIKYWCLLQRQVQRFKDAGLQEITTSVLHSIGMEAVRVSRSNKTNTFV